MSESVNPDSSSDNTPQVGSQEPHEIGGPYSRYVLTVLVIVYVFNFIDRQILSILNEEIKLDLGLSDADMGFLYGTAFAVFYAVFGIPLGRLADNWSRKSLISIGLAFWSLMTALSGTAKSFFSLAGYRIGVGIGEASASPAANSMLCDYFPPRLRTTALAIYSSGVYIGAGIGVFLGGTIVDTWNGWYPDITQAPYGLKGWQVAFFAVGLPGVLMALWVWTLREPVRGLSEGIVMDEHPHPFREFFASLGSVLPPFTLFSLGRIGGFKAVRANLIALVLVGLAAAGLIALTGDEVQWIALAIGVYAALSWAHSLKLTDPASHSMIFQSRTLRFVALGFPAASFVTYGVGYWTPPFMLRVHGVGLSEASLYIGLGSALGGWIGVTMGGVLADRFRDASVNSRLYVGMAGPGLAIPVGLLFLTTETVWVAYLAAFGFSLLSPMWVGCAATAVSEMVLPRMRGVATAFYVLMLTFIGLALGPYVIGRLSDGFVQAGTEPGAALQQGMLIGLSMLVVSVVLVFVATRFQPPELASRLDRGRALGEAV
ncbi:MAG: MFS transporter [Pseudomonadaceae bacterium]|nr:MFS transporter [Pseudomonadaceae bacterium]